MITYIEFNKRVFDFYFTKVSSPFCTVALEQEDLNGILAGMDLPEFPCLKERWSNLLMLLGGIPQYFGLLAIQCYAATLMENDQKSTDRAYKLRLAQILRINNVGELDSLMTERVKGNTIQELIWIYAKQFILETWSQHLDIPAIKTHAFKHVQFPKSQSLLNREDLKCFSSFFLKSFKFDDSVNFEYFKIQLGHFINSSTTQRVKNVFNNPLKREPAFRQVFNAFLSWDGSGSEIEKNEKETKLDQNLIFRFINDQPRFYLYPSLVEIPGGEVLSYRGYRPFYSELRIFNEMEYYLNEYEDSRFIYEKRPVFILVKNNSNSRLYSHLSNNSLQEFEITSEQTLFKITIEDPSMSGELASYFSDIQPVTLLGGLKLSGGKVYLQGFGPTILSSFDFTTLCDSQVVKYNPSTAVPGTYYVRSGRFKDCRFVIKNSVAEFDKINARNNGWNLSSYNINQQFDVEGCMVKQTKKKVQPLNEWLKLSSGMPSKKNTRFNNILLEALRKYYV